MRFGHLASAAVAATLVVGAGGGAKAALIVSGSVGGAPTGVTLENLDNLPLGSAGGTTLSGIEVVLTPNAAAVIGSVAGVYAAPFLSGGNGAGFGSPNQPDGPDTTVYVTSGSTGATAAAAIEFVLPFLAQYFGLLWGSVDDYNTLSFFNGATLVGTVTGLDVTGSPNGDQGINGTLYVNINSTEGFNRVRATSTQFAFEIDNLAINRTQVPEPGTLALIGAGLAGAGLALRRRRTAVR